MTFGRLITAMVTPFNDNLQVDIEQINRLIHYLIDEQQTDSIVVTGTTGESPTLSDDEKCEIYRTAVKAASGKCKIIAGTCGNNTAHSIEMTRKAEQMGVDGILAVVPYYNKPNQEGLFQHFKSIANYTQLPVFLYNIPGRSVINMTAATILRLAQIDNIVAVKESGSIEQMSSVVSQAPEGFKCYSGDDSMALPSLAIGGYGIISVASHIIGSPIKKMIQRYLEGRPAEAAQIHQQYFSVFKGLFECPNPTPNPVAVKYALNKLGMHVGGVRLPLVNASEKEALFLDQLLSEI